MQSESDTKNYYVDISLGNWNYFAAFYDERRNLKMRQHILRRLENYIVKCWHKDPEMFVLRKGAMGKF